MSLYPLRTISVILMLLFVGALQAQKELTLSDAVLKQRTELAPENLTQLSWIPETDAYSFIKEQDDDQLLVKQTISSSEEKVLFKLSDFSKLVDAEKPLKTFPRITWIDKVTFRLQHQQTIYQYNIQAGALKKVISFPEKAAFVDYKRVQNCAAYLQDEDLFIQKGDASPVQITKDGNTDGIVYGQAVHRHEFGIAKGTFWSPKGNLLAFYRMDESMVTNYPLVNIDELPAKDQQIRYPMAGMKSHEVQVGISDLKGKKVIYLQTGEPKEQYLTNISWGPEEKYIYIAVVNRDQNHMRLNQYEVATGKLVKTLFEEKNDKYVEPEHPMRFLDGSPNEFLWYSERDGFQHIYRYNTSGKLINKVTTGKRVVTGIIGFGPAEQDIYYSATGDNATEFQLFKSKIDGSETKQLTSEKGTHSGLLSSSGKYLIDQYSSLSVPRNISVIDSKGTKVKDLLIATNPLEEYNLPQAEIFSINAEDGTPLFCRIIKPNNFDPSKKYPVLVYVYGGPHVQLIQNRWLGGAPMWMYYMANQGYIIFTLDNRGSLNRGLEFEQATFRQLGEMEMKDQLTGVNYLQDLPYVDGKRMAVHGWSFGGYMTTSLMLRYPGVFKAGIAGGPVIDWKYYEVMYTERYMDTPETNPEGFRSTSLLDKVDKLEGDLLMIHGAVDNVVVWQHSLAFVKNCVDQGVQLDYFVYPGHPHNVRGKDRVHLMTKVLNYVMDKLED